MSVAVKWGVLLAVVVTVFNVVWVLAGMHTNPVAAIGYLAVVTILAILSVVLALKATAGENPYGRQLLSGLVVGLVGGVVIFLTSWITLAFILPDTIPEQVAGFSAAYESMPIPEEQKTALVAALENVTPVSSALQGFVGTVITCFVVGAITGAFLRRK